MSRPDMEKITRGMLRDISTWPHVTHLCVKQGNPLVTGRGKCGVVLWSECEPNGITVRSHPGIGSEMYGGPFVEKFDDIDALIDAGWIVD